MAKWVGYKNGNYNVHIDLETGTKVRENNLDFFECDTVESMDVKITNCCDVGCKFCLLPDAKLIEEKQLKNISDVKVGNKVLSYNTEKGVAEFKNVSRLFERDYIGDLIVIETASGKILKLTPNHKIFTQRGYVRADELLNSDELLIY